MDLNLPRTSLREGTVESGSILSASCAVGSTPVEPGPWLGERTISTHATPHGAGCSEDSAGMWGEAPLQMRGC